MDEVRKLVADTNMHRDTVVIIREEYKQKLQRQEEVSEKVRVSGKSTEGARPQWTRTSIEHLGLL
jgi:hypothetical protein